MTAHVSNDGGVNNVNAVSQKNSNDRDIQQIVMEMVKGRISHLENCFNPNMAELAKRQQIVRDLNALISRIQSNTNEEGKVTLSAHELALIESFCSEEYSLPSSLIEVKNVGEVYTAEEVDKLIQNINLYADADKKQKALDALENRGKNGKVVVTREVFDSLSAAKIKKNHDALDFHTLKNYMPEREGDAVKDKEINKERRDQLLDILSRHIKDLETKNDMQYQKIQRFVQEKYQTYEIAKSFMKSIEDALKRMAQAIAGR